MAITYSAGVVTAYGAAKKAGYTGSYQQFCQDQANFATNATQVAADKTTIQGWVTTLREYKETAEQAANAAQDYAATASAAFQTDLLADPYDARKRYNTGEYVIQEGVMYRCTTPITVAERWTPDHWAQVTVSSELISALEEVITKLFQRNKTYVVGDYVIYDNMLYRCIQPTKPGYNWNPSQWAHVTIASEFADRVTELEQSFAFPENKNLVNPALQQVYQGNIFSGFSQYYVSAYIPFTPEETYILRTVDGPGDFVYEIFDKEKSSLSDQIQILATDPTNDMTIRFDDPEAALIRIISPLSLENVMLCLLSDGATFKKFKLKSSAYISTIMDQDLTDDQKAMVQHNLGLDNISEIVTGVVKYNEAQELTDEEKEQAQANLGLSDVIQRILDNLPSESDLVGAVRYDQGQELDETQKAQARTNIGAIDESSVSDYNDRIGDLEENISEYSGAVKRITKNSQGLQVEYFEGSPSQVELAESEKLHLYYDSNENLLYLQNENDENQGSAVYIAGGGGGGGGAVSANVKIERVDAQGNPTSVSTMDVVTGDPAVLRYKLKVVEAGEDGEEIAGTATARWYNNSIFLTSTTMTHNTVESFDIAPYLQPGSNNISVSVSVPVGGDIMIPASRGWSVKLVDLYFTWNFETSRINTMAFTDSYTVYGDVDKYMHLVIDAADINNPEDSEDAAHSPYPEGKKIEGSGRETKETIQKLEHGVHTLTRWLTAKVNGQDVNPKYQTFETIFFKEGETGAVVSADTSDFTIDQYSTKKIMFIVADPLDLTVDARILVDGVEKATFTQIGRSPQPWNYTAMESGYKTIRIEALRRSGNETTVSAVKEFHATVRSIQMNVIETPDYKFKLKASDLGSNNDLRTWHNADNDVNLEFSDNFDWVNGGLKYETDDDGNIRQYICVKAGTRMTVKHKLFGVAAQDTGLDFKVAFKVTNVQDYDATWGECIYNGRGLRLHAHNAEMFSNEYVSTLYEEDSYIEYELEIYKKDQDATHAAAPHNYILAWLDGVPANIAIYNDADSFSHPRDSASYITIGSDDCDVYIYLMKVYQHDIDYQEHVDNFIMDAPTGEEMIKRYNRNDIMNAVTNEIDYQKLADKNRDLRVYLYHVPYLTMDKIKKDEVKNCTFQQIWRNGGEEYQLQGKCSMGVQGTSSINYRRGAANTDSRFTELSYTKGGQVVDLLENGVYVKDKTYGDNWYVKDPENPTVPRIYTKLDAYVEAKLRKTYSVKEARSAARLQDGEELDPTEWIVYEVDENEEPVKYIRASEEDYETKILGPEWVVRYRDENDEATHYVKALGYKINDTSCPITYSNIKVNYASCEQVNNYCNAMWYQKFQPYPSKTARDCMEFSMGVQFIRDDGDLPNDGKHMLLFTKPEVDAQGNVVMVDGKPKYVQDGKDSYHMYSIANMGTSKNNVHIFHDISNPNEVCVEVKNNTSRQCRFMDYSEDPINWDAGDQDPFELRYPSTKSPKAEIDTAWRRLWRWFSENNPADATNRPLDNPETYGEYVFRGHHRKVPTIQNEELTNFAQVLRGTKVTQYKGTYTADTFERRMAKMLSECEDYLAMDSVIYHFLFIERHTAVDNVAKNTFWSTDDLIHWDLSKAYDMDTSDGNNNEGVMSFDYGNEWNDVIGSKTVFNANDSVWFVFAANLKEACKTMFINREALGAWNYRTYHAFLKKEQDKVPERCWVQCYYYDYIRTYERQLELVADRYTYLDGGRKTHQREHFEKFQELYMSGKYNGTASGASAIILRGYSPSTYAPTVPPLPKVKLKMYNKMYATVDVDGKLFTRKFEKDENEFIDFSSEHLNDSVIKIYPASMIQEIDNLASIYGGDYSFGAANKLKTLKLGSDAPGYKNSNFFNLRLGNNPMLESLEVQNLIDGTEHKVGALDLSNCPSLKTIDASGSDFTGITFASNGLVNSVKLKAPTALIMQNLRYLTDENLTITDYSKLYRLAVENCDYVDVLAMIKTILLIQNNSLSEARLIGMLWNSGLNAEVLAALYAMSGFDENGHQTIHAVLAGEGSLLTLTRRLQNLYRVSWPNFDLSVISPTEERIVTFVNEDGTPILDKNGEEYFQYIEEGNSAYDPIQAGEIDTPTIAETAEYTAIFDYFDNLGGAVYMDKTVTAMYRKTKKSYRVTWYTDLGGNELHHQTVEYGTEAVYDYDALGYPTKGLTGGTYSVFKGWDKSTGFITGPTNVYAQWDTYRGEVVKIVPNSSSQAAGYVELKNMTPAQIYAAITQGAAEQYWEIKDYIDINVGADYDFSNVESRVIVGDGGIFGKDLVLTGNRVETTNIKLFNAEAPSFTLAVDYEFTSETVGRTLVACYDSSSSSAGGFQLVFQTATTSPNLNWGDQTSSVGNYGMKRGILVIVHEKGSRTLTIFSNNQTTRYLDLIYANTLTRTTSFASENAVLTFGGILGSGNSQSNMATGVIHWCKIWYDTLGTTVTRSLANWPHETWRMHFAGSGFYQKASDGLWTNATFVSNSVLPQPHPYMTSGQDPTGYSLSEMHAFMNGATINGVKYTGRVFEALPFEWKSLIQKVSLIEQRFMTDYVQTQATFQTRIHIPAYRCFQEYSNYDYNNEDKQIPWFATSTGIQDLTGNNNGLTDKQYNRKEIFPGYILDENVKRYRSQSDPSVSSVISEPIKDGDIWHNYNSGSTYIYISNSTLANKGWIVGRNKNTTDTNYIFDASNHNGKWIVSVNNMATRTHYFYRNYYFYVVSGSSLSASYSNNLTTYLKPMFSI